jgi:hypothetical protein
VWGVFECGQGSTVAALPLCRGCSGLLSTRSGRYSFAARQLSRLIPVRHAAGVCAVSLGDQGSMRLWRTLIRPRLCHAVRLLAGGRPACPLLCVFPRGFNPRYSFAYPYTAPTEHYCKQSTVFNRRTTRDVVLVSPASRSLLRSLQAFRVASLESQGLITPAPRPLHPTPATSLTGDFLDSVQDRLCGRERPTKARFFLSWLRESQERPGCESLTRVSSSYQEGARSAHSVRSAGALR